MVDKKGSRKKVDRKVENNIKIPESLRGKVIVYEDKLVMSSQVRESIDAQDFYSRLKRDGTVKTVKVLSPEKYSEFFKKIQNESGDGNDSVTEADALSLFHDASKKGASDIHIRVYLDAGYTDVLYRINGSLESHHQWDAKYGHRLCSTIYGVIAANDVAGTAYTPTKYQSARIAAAERLPSGLHGIRIESGPQTGGTFMVMRLLYEDSGGMGDTSFEERMSGLGYTGRQIKRIGLMRQKPKGLNIICGETGSGKSTTLKHVLEAIRQEEPDKNIMTAEDPPEYPIKGVVQLPVLEAKTAEERNQNFVEVIKTMLRSDPDICMVGEIRDGASARMGIRAAQTGHQVWTTVHANNALDIIDRLTDILVSPEMPDPARIFAKSTVLNGLIAQTLIKKLCPHCKKPFREHENEVSYDLRYRMSQVMDLSRDNIHLRNHDGCDKCSDGIAGRMVVAEVINPDSKLLRIIREKGTDEAKKYWLEDQDGRTILYHAIQAVRQGHADPADVESKTDPLNSEGLLQDENLSVDNLYDMTGAQPEDEEMVDFDMDAATKPYGQAQVSETTDAEA